MSGKYSDIYKGQGSDWHRIREVWKGLKKRCENPNCKDYKGYHGKGITICAEWHDFETFYEWSITHGYRSDLTLDRINNSKGYNPTNCRWVSRRAQAYNRTTNRYIRSSDGEVRTLEEWARRQGVEPSTVSRRLERGWTVDEAVGKKPRK